MNKNMRDTISIKKIGNNLILKQKSGRFFISTRDSFIISIQKLAVILKFLIINNYMSVKVLEGIVEEYYMNQGDELWK